MYPKDTFELFPPFPREDKVFVAMSFDERFDARWKDVIQPAIKESDLEPLRVDMRSVSDSILTLITRSIAKSRFVFADITVMFTHEDEKGNKHDIRNANVMYEVGLAHAVRLQEEILLFRSDDGRLPFDVATIRVNKYNPDGDPTKAKAQIKEAIENAKKEVNLLQLTAVERAAANLDVTATGILAEAFQDPVTPSIPREPILILQNIDRTAAIRQLLDLGLLHARCAPKTDLSKADQMLNSEFMIYNITLFGKAVLDYIRSAFKESRCLDPQSPQTRHGKSVP